jgi:hypothetical protein
VFSAENFKFADNKTDLTGSINKKLGYNFELKIDKLKAPIKITGLKSDYKVKFDLKKEIKSKLNKKINKFLGKKVKDKYKNELKKMFGF